MTSRAIAYIAHKLVRHLGIDFLRIGTLERLLKSERYADRGRMLEALAQVLDEHDLFFFAQRVGRSRAQILQDLFVLHELNAKRNGFFVEFGATNGVDLSNTYLLETDYEWTGILAEPARAWHQALAQNRRCLVDHRCVWKSSQQRIAFKQSTAAELSSIEHLGRSDYRSAERSLGTTYDVETVSLNDLLDQHRAPTRIDYLSVDTEGSEFEILRAFDFKKYDVRTITVEHNHTPARERIYDLLTTQGFVRKYETCTQFDDWYVAVEPA
jgi:FkbM family methyltransferase